MLIFICVEEGGGSLSNMLPIYDRFETHKQTKKNCAKTHKNTSTATAMLSSSLK